ncbi:calcium binding EGF domain-containing protein, partial [Aphelenchoides avenae]
AIVVAASIYGTQLCNLTTARPFYLDGKPKFQDCHTSSPDTGAVLNTGSPPLVFFLAVDWIHGTYYYSGNDPVEGIGAIGVHNIATGRRRLLFSGFRNLIQPYDIEVDPLAGYIFWADAARDAIVRSDTDGRNLKEIVSSFGRSAIALDVSAGRIYWIEAHSYHIIASADYHGKDVRTVTQSCSFVTGYSHTLAVVGERVYWTQGNTVLSVSKHGNGTEPAVVFIADEDIEVMNPWYHGSQPTGINKCEGHTCEYMCLPRSNENAETLNGTAADDLTYSCACELGKRSVWRNGRNACDADATMRRGIVVPL